MEGKEIFAVALVALLAFSVSISVFGSPYLFTLESYSHALNVEKAVNGEPVGAISIYYPFAALVYSRVAALSDATEFDPALLVTTLKVLSALLAAVAGVGAYFALRAICKQETSAFGAVLLGTSVAAASVFLAGFVSPASLGLALLLCGIALLLHGLERKDARFSAGGGLLAALALASWGEIAFSFAAVIAALAAQAVYNEHEKKRDETLIYSIAGFGLVGFVGVALLGFPGIAAGIDFVSELGMLMFFAPLALLALLVAVVKALGKAEVGKRDVFALSFGFASIVAGAYSTAAALPGLALLAAFALERLPEIAKQRKVALIVAGAVAGFASFIFLLGVMPSAPAALLGALLGVGAAFAAGMYGGEKFSEHIAWALAVLLVVASVSSALLLAQNQERQMGAELESALNWIASSTPKDSVIAVAGEEEMYGFLTQRKTVSLGVPEWLLGPGNKTQLQGLGADYILMDVSYFDRLEQLKNATGKTDVRMDSFAFYGYRDDDAGVRYGFFISQAGNAAYIPYSESAGFDPSSDAFVVEASGNSRRVPFARFVMVKDGNGQIVRAIYPYEDYDTNLFNAFFGTVDGLAKAYPEGEGTARVYEVNAG